MTACWIQLKAFFCGWIGFLKLFFESHSNALPHQEASSKQRAAGSKLKMSSSSSSSSYSSLPSPPSTPSSSSSLRPLSAKISIKRKELGMTRKELKNLEEGVRAFGDGHDWKFKCVGDLVACFAEESTAGQNLSDKFSKETPRGGQSYNG